MVQPAVVLGVGRAADGEVPLKDVILRSKSQSGEAGSGQHGDGRQGYHARHGAFEGLKRWPGGVGDGGRGSGPCALGRLTTRVVGGRGWRAMRHAAVLKR